MTVKITHKTETTERRFAEIRGQLKPVAERGAGDGRYPITLDDLRGFIAAAEASQVPDDAELRSATAGLGALLGNTAPLTHLIVDVQVAVQEKGEAL